MCLSLICIFESYILFITYIKPQFPLTPYLDSILHKPIWPYAVMCPDGGHNLGNTGISLFFG